MTRTPAPGADNRETRIRKTLLTGFIIVLFLLGAWRVWALSHTRRAAYPEYSFRATRGLLACVEEGARLLADQGEKAFAAFDTQPFRNDKFYLYVYRSEDGRCLYHGGSPDLVGRQGIDFIDLHGKQVHSLVLGEFSNPDNPHCWVHYLWTPPGEILPLWKSSCHKQVVMPDGTGCYVGGGVSETLYETEFARIAVNSAVRLLAEQGGPALTTLTAPEKNFTFLDAGVFVLDERGVSIIDPAFKRYKSRDMTQYRDASDRFPFRLLLDKLADSPVALAPLYAAMPQSMNLRKKIIYARKTRMGDTPVIVGMAMNAPENIWQR